MYQKVYDHYPDPLKGSGNSYFRLSGWNKANSDIPQIMQEYDIEWYEAVYLYYTEDRKWKGYFSLLD